MSINSREELEEERRLFYVVITRAKKKLWISYANTRYRFGQLVQNEPSRFLEELPEDDIDRSYAGGGFRNSTGFSGAGSFNRTASPGWASQNNSKQAEKQYGPPPKKKPELPSYIGPKPTTKTVDHQPSTNFQASDTASLQAGQKVEHQKFGFGEILKIEGSHLNPIATVKFDKNGEKKIMLNYAKLMIIE